VLEGTHEFDVLVFRCVDDLEVFVEAVFVELLQCQRIVMLVAHAASSSEVVDEEHGCFLVYGVLEVVEVVKFEGERHVFDGGLVGLAGVLAGDVAACTLPEHHVLHAEAVAEHGQTVVVFVLQQRHLVEHVADGSLLGVPLPVCKQLHVASHQKQCVQVIHHLHPIRLLP